tara:strand:+ start:995 stop:2074 length:1080 start_codon:yes stop_codon:yes gene_type:complete
MAVSRINEAGLNVNQFGNRNVIINGAMQVAQRGTSQTDVAAQGYYTVDRFEIQMSSAGRFTMTQESDGPDGFANSIKLACTTADTSVGASEILTLRTVLESQDLQRFKKGTSAAEKMTLSFYVKGNAAATYMAELEDRDNSRNNTVKFNVTTSWTRVSITFNADTTGAFDDDNAEGLRVNFWLHAGSTYNGGTYTENTWASSVSANKAVGIDSFFDSTSRTFFITGIQLEVGDTATDFEHRTFADELARCRRYYEVTPAASASDPVIIGSGMWYNSASAYVTIFYSNKRTDPTITAPTVTGGYRFYFGNSYKTVNSIAFQRQKPDNARISAGSSGATQGDGSWGEMVATGAKIEIDAEL